MPRTAAARARRPATRHRAPGPVGAVGRFAAAVLALVLPVVGVGGVAAARSSAEPVAVGRGGPAWSHLGERAPARAARPPSTTAPPSTRAPSSTTAQPSTTVPRAAPPSAVPPSTLPPPVAPRPAPSRTAGGPTPAAPATSRPAERVVSAYVTGYSWFDNTPAGSVVVSHPVVHRTAGGTGTWADPLTVAVGHSLAGGSDVLQWPAGTRFYVPGLRRYLVVEDTCGDGPTPEDEPCSTGYPAGTTTWLDVWIDGRGSSPGQVDSCASALTDSYPVVVDPGPDHPVTAGPLAGGGACAR